MRRLLHLLVTLAGLLAAGHALAQPAAPANPDPADLSTLAALLRDPAIQAWLQAQAEHAPAPPPVASPPDGAHEAMVGELDAVRAFLHELVAAVPQLPEQLGRAWHTLAGDAMQDRGVLDVALLLVVFAALGFGLEGLFWWATTGFRQRMIATPLDTAKDRLQAVGRRFAYGIGLLLAFALGSIGGFLLFEWPRVLKEVVLAYLMVFLVIRLVLVLGRILLAPAAERFRMVPMATASARFWFVWSAVLVGWFAFVNITLDVLTLLGASEPARYLIGLACGVVLVALALFVVWRHPERESGLRVRRSHRVGTWLLSVYVVVVWLLLFTGSVAPFYVGVILLLLPIAIRSADLAVNHVLRPAGDETAADAVPSVTAVCLERGLRAALLIGGAYLIAWFLGVDFGEMTSQDTLQMRLMRGAINVVVILLLADFAWHLLAAWIDCKLVEASGATQSDSEDARRRARLRTLLPILRNILLIVVVTMAVLMALSAVGVEIGPLIAGAGVVGVAIGFGAQTLVKDIISGMFYLLDDAFRVGEYIQSGKYKGTVESFSLRSVKLRHHRGPLYTVPFGELGAVENMSRDWVIDKISVNVTYDTDLDLAKKIIKQVGAELAQDPEFAPNILETLKMQGVEQFGDFAIQIRMKMMTKPGEQFVIRRRAYGMIKKAFNANGIRIALPTVSVAGGGDPTAAVAQQAVEMTRPPSSTGETRYGNTPWKSLMRRA
ncbi:MAG TPA: mechanosensitive ion channel family protein [Geminicoccaceae bacterium]|nr:mechanosensitive ion channel family protein [Geminicoccaceae bacterium]